MSVLIYNNVSKLFVFFLFITCMYGWFADYSENFLYISMYVATVYNYCRSHVSRGQ